MVCKKEKTLENEVHLPSVASILRAVSWKVESLKALWSFAIASVSLGESRCK